MNSAFIVDQIASSLVVEMTHHINVHVSINVLGVDRLLQNHLHLVLHLHVVLEELVVLLFDFRRLLLDAQFLLQEVLVLVFNHLVQFAVLIRSPLLVQFRPQLLGFKVQALQFLLDRGQVIHSLVLLNEELCFFLALDLLEFLNEFLQLLFLLLLAFDLGLVFLQELELNEVFFAVDAAVHQVVLVGGVFPLLLHAGFADVFPTEPAEFLGRVAVAQLT